MSDRFYSVEQVAEHLGLHVRTVRNYVRDGRLPAVRIGKQYRIAHEDLETFTGRPVPAPDHGTAVRQRHTEVSSIVEIEDIDSRTVDRLTSLLMTAAAGRGPGERPLRIETVHDRDRARLKVIVLGGVADTARLLDYMEGVLAS
ncbi:MULTISPECIES: helix-turn-helix domain-containing protein [Streptomyces]|uniref:helix-turn-helix domain-containing protein n=1 Tax=Streptomyces TaxID=1883 RepID=UPI001963613A|nr:MULTISPECIES: helix-turn-helix domain-containing protein [Streptomyces]QRX89895.1 helix-turn-helix domain-containing protein [Streptomyces noursei]UJB39909.1 helix-turn-helix domain-containing protein [Streptomyces sp. A1-5]